MKVPIDDYSCIDLDAPTLQAYEVCRSGVTYWLVWCEHCKVWHRHGAAEGHRESHCTEVSSPFHKSGYNLAFAGQMRAVVMVDGCGSYVR